MLRVISWIVLVPKTLGQCFFASLHKLRTLNRELAKSEQEGRALSSARPEQSRQIYS
jgi:hypothetical protein